MPDQVHDSRDPSKPIEPVNPAMPARADARISASTLEAARAVNRYYASLPPPPAEPAESEPTSGS